MPRYRTNVRRPRRMHGRGDFFSDAWDNVRSAVSAVGRPLARAAGSALGGGLGKAALGLAGLGAYRARYANPSAIKGRGRYRTRRSGPQSYRSSRRPPRAMIDEGTSPAQMRNGSKSYVIISHREYLGDIKTAGSTFTAASYPINPGMVQTFPWLCSIAQNFISWKPRGMAFEFKSMSADALNSTNTALGEVLMATQYNVGAPAFTNQANMLNYDKCTAAKPSTSFYSPVECAARQLAYKKYFVRHGSIPSGEDYRLYDVGTFYIATYGQQAAATIGQLWLTYELELLEPTMVGGAGSTVLTDYWSSTTGITTSKYFGSSVIPSSANSLGLTLAATTITFPSYIVQGKYQIVYWLASSSTAFTCASVAATTNCTKDTTTDNISPNAGATVTRSIVSCVITITGGSAVVTFSGGTFGTISNMQLMVTQIDADNAFDTSGTAVSI